MKKVLGFFGLLILIALIFTLVSATNIQKGAWDTGKAITYVDSCGVADSTNKMDTTYAPFQMYVDNHGKDAFDTLYIVVGGDTTIVTTDTTTNQSISLWQTEGNANMVFGSVTNYIERQGSYSGIFSGKEDSMGGTPLASFMGGGEDNTLNNDHNAMIGGQYNECSGFWSVIAGGFKDTLTSYMKYAFMGGGQENYITAWATNTENHSSIVGGYKNYIKCQGSFIGSGYGNYIYMQCAGVTNGLNAIVGGDRDTIWGEGNPYYTQFNFIGSGRFNKIYRASGNVILGGISNYITAITSGSGAYTYSTIFSGKACSTWTKMATAMGFESKVYGAIDDSINFAGGVGGICDSTMGSFAWNCKVKDVDSTFGITKQIHVMLGVDTTIITSTEVKANKIESRFFFQELLQDASYLSGASGGNVQFWTGLSVFSSDSVVFDSLHVMYWTNHNDVYIDSIGIARGSTRTGDEAATVFFGDATNYCAGTATFVPVTYIINQTISYDWRIYLRVYVATSGVAGSGRVFSAKGYFHY